MATLALLLPHALRAAQPLEPPAWLPRYQLDVQLELDQHFVFVKERVTWTNHHQLATQELVFNAHSHYQVPDADVGFMAKMLELLRMTPSDSLDFEGPPLEIESVTSGTAKLAFHYREDNQTALVVPLPAPVKAGESVSVEICFRLRLPQKQGRWGQWEGLTTLVTWLPVVAFYDDDDWHPAPFIPWHQPFFNEAGIYEAQITLPCDQKFVCGATVRSVQHLDQSKQLVTFAPFIGRDFPFLCSAQYEEHLGQAGNIKVRCMAFPKHAEYARKMVQWVCEAIPEYERLIGPYAYPEFNVAEAYFGWNGNECSGLVMIDERVFNMPSLASPFVEHLVSHELLHQWFYNVVGTNGYGETWMDEGFVNYLTHRFIDRKKSKDNSLLDYPKGFGWLPQIKRETYRSYTMYGTIARGESGPTVQDMPKYGHLVNLLGVCYDRGGRVVGLIEEKLGTTAFYDFLRILYKRYYFKVLRVKDLQRELEEYTGRSWDTFFKEWVYGAGYVDWCVESVRIKPALNKLDYPVKGSFLQSLHGKHAANAGYQTTIVLHQKAELNEPTILGIALDGTENYAIRIPVYMSDQPDQLQDPPASIRTLPDNRVEIEVFLPCKPTQITVDPDQVLADKNPVNNSWKTRFRWRFSPCYSPLEETDLTNDYDKWNITFGPGFFGSAYTEPWYDRATIFGARAGIYRTQDFHAGASVGYRTDYRDVAAEADALWDHLPFSHTQIGIHAERSLTSTNDQEDRRRNRGVLFARYIFQYGDSLYLPPMHYVEVFTTKQQNPLPLPRVVTPDADHFDRQATAGVHYRIDYLTPYWDPEGGFRFDATYETGMPIWGEKESFNRASAQFSTVKGLPAWTGPLSETRVAARLYAAGGLPDKGQFFPLGGSALFRGFDLSERQGSVAWVGSVEWRVPIVRRVEWDCCDHVVGIRNIYTAAFYDAGNAYVNGRELGSVAHALGAGLRIDVAWFSLIERTTLRMDVAKTLNTSNATQFWFGITHPF